MARPVAFALAITLLVSAGCGGGSGGDDLAVIPPKAPDTFKPGVAVRADADVDDQPELYVADLEGDGLVKVSGALVAGGQVGSFRWSPDRSMLAFLADKDTDDVVELYVVAAAGGPVTKVSGLLVPNGDVTEFAWSPDSTRLAYLADQDTDEVPELYTAPVQGGLSAKVSGAMALNAYVRAFAWAPDASRIAYLADQDEEDVIELFTSLPAGGGNVQVSGPMVPGGTIYITTLDAPFEWAPDSSRIAYLANQEQQFVQELFTSLPAGGGNVKVSGAFAPLTMFRAVYEYAWSPDSDHLAYAANLNQSTRGQVFVVAPDGTGHLPVLDLFEDGYAFRLQWSPDGAYVGGLVDPIGTFASGSLFAAPPSGPPVGPSQWPAVNYAWSPDSERVAFADSEVRVVPVALLYGMVGDAPQVSSLAPGETIQPHTLGWAPDASRVAYLSQDLHVSFPTTDYGAERITPLLHGTDRSVTKYEWTTDSLGLVFAADIGAAKQVELFVSPRDAASLTTISPPLVFGGQVLDFEVR